LAEGLGKVSDSACFKLLFMRQLLLTGYHFDTESYQRIQVPIYLPLGLSVSLSSVADPPDPYVFGPPGSFYYQAKMVRKTLIPAVLGLLDDFLSLKNDVNVASKLISKKT
jgi:hypothetical protein